MSTVFTEHHHSLRSRILAIAESREVGFQEFRPEVTESTVLCLSNFCMPIAADCGARFSRQARTLHGFQQFDRRSLPESTTARVPISRSRRSFVKAPQLC
ncbi:MAG TPA: hypothetical protein VN326_12145 [Casimicrobiaceae bacterium]|nr:hypothetical protein [Casimicrobiaceae bacterium]